MYMYVCTYISMHTCMYVMYGCMYVCVHCKFDGETRQMASNSTIFPNNYEITPSFKLIYSSKSMTHPFVKNFVHQTLALCGISLSTHAGMYVSTYTCMHVCEICMLAANNSEFLLA